MTVQVFALIFSLAALGFSVWVNAQIDKMDRRRRDAFDLSIKLLRRDGGKEG